jgi:hypothetical protein
MAARFLAQPDFVRLLRFWVDRRGERSVPEWDGDLGQVPHGLLPNLVITERRPDPVYRYVGAEDVRTFGSDPTGQRIYEDVLRGDHSRYIRSVAEDTLAHRAPIFSAAIYRAREDMLTGFRLLVPFTDPGETAMRLIFSLQLFTGTPVKLAELADGGFVDELERNLVVGAPEICARLEQARRYQLLAGRIHQGAMAGDLAAHARELAGGALLALPVFDRQG